MTPKPRTHEPAGGDGLFFLIAAAIVAVVSIEALFIAFSSWWLLALVLVIVIAAAIGVSAALVRLIDHDTPLARSPRAAEPQPAAAPLARPVAPARARALTH